MKVTLLHAAVGSKKDWKPKSISQNYLPVSGVIGTPTSGIRASEASISSPQSSGFANLEDQTTKLQEKLEDLYVRDDQHVIIPNHLQVPEADRTGIGFGSFGIGFATNVSSSFATNSVQALLMMNVMKTTHLCQMHPGKLRNQMKNILQGLCFLIRFFKWVWPEI